MSLISAQIPDRFELRRLLGAGGQGVVFEAWDRDWERDVALKVIRYVEPAAAARLKREFRLLAHHPHPNRVRMHGLYTTGEGCCYAMELVRGQPVLAHLRGGALDPLGRAADTTLSWDDDEPPPAPSVRARGRGPVDAVRVRDVVAQLCEALLDLHARGLVHCDVKSSNVLVRDDGRLKLLDFGLAEQTGLRGPRVAGTVGYMAPEVALGAAPMPAADWYAVGVLLHEALTGALPDSGSALPQLPETEDLVDVCVGLLDPDPTRRWGGRQVLEALDPRCDVAARWRRGPTATTLVGRTPELAALDRALTESFDGNTVLVLVEGPAGIGRTALLGSFRRSARDRGARVALARCHPGDSGPFSAWEPLLEELTHRPGADGGTPRRSPSGSPLRLPDGAAVAPRDRWRVAAQALSDRLAALATTGPIALLIDDADVADEDSRRLLGELLGAARPSGLLLVLTVDPAAATAPELRALASMAAVQGPVHRLHLAPLARADAVQLARQVAGATLTDTAVARVVAESAGQPATLIELARPGGPEADPAERIAASSASARRVLQVLSLTGAPPRWQVACEAAGLPLTRWPAVSAELVAAHLVRPHTVDHRVELWSPAVRAAAGDSLDRDTRRALHLALGAVGRADDPVEAFAKATHLRSAGDARGAAMVAMAAVDTARDQLAFAREADLMAIVVEAHDAEPERWCRFGQALRRAGRSAAAAEAFLRADQHTPGGDRQLRLAALEQMAMVGYYDRALSMARELLAEVGEALPADRLRLVGGLLGRRVFPSYGGRGGADAAEQYRLFRVLSDSFTWMDPPLGVYLHTRALQLAMTLGDGGALVESCAVEAGMVAFARGPAALTTLERDISALDGVCPERSAAALDLVCGLRHLVLGAWAPALRRLRLHTARAGRTHPGDRRPEMVARVYEFEALFRLGRVLELRAVIVPLLARARASDDVAVMSFYAVQATFSAMSAGAPEAAREVLAELEQRRWGQASPWAREMAEAFILGSRCHLALYEGDGTGAWKLHQQAVGRLMRNGGLTLPYWRATFLEVRGRCALAAAAEAPARERRSLLATCRRTVALLRTMRLPWAEPLALSLAAGEAASRGRADMALRLHREAVDGFEAREMVLYAAVERWRVGLLEGGASGEARVAEARATMRAAGVAEPVRFAASFAHRV